MTISTADNTPRISYTVAQGATQTAFAVPFEFFADADLNFYVDGTKKTLATHYTTSANAQNNLAHSSGTTGYIHTTTDNSITGATGGSTVIITRDIAFARTTDFPTAGAFDVDTLNSELDRITAIASDLEDLASRSVRLVDYDSEVSMELPVLASRKGTVLGFNASTGVAEAGPSITAVQSLADVTTSINLLGTSAVVEDLGILATSANVTAMGHLGTSGNVTAMGLLGTSAVVTDMGLLGTTACVADMAILGTTDNVANMALLATTDIISDLNTLATSAIVEDLNLLATSTVIADMASLAGSGANPNITSLTASGEIAAASLDISGNVDVDGTLEADAMTLNGTAITTTSTLSTGISNGNLPVFTSGVADDDFLRVSGTSIEGRSASEVLSDIGGQASLTFGISNTNAVKVDSSSVADDEYARFTANGLESRSTSEVLSDIGGQASLTFGISNTNAVKIDSASVADDEYARFTANGLESRSTSEVLSDIGATTATAAADEATALAIALGG